MLQLSWSGTGSLVAVIADDSFYILRFDRDAYNSALESGASLGDEGVEAAFDVIAEISERYVFQPLPVYCKAYMKPKRENM